MRKTKFYDGFTTFNPNLFGTQDELIHGMRRRQMAHAFSMQSIQGMEHFIDNHMLKLRRSLDLSADSGEIFDLKKLISFYILDVLGDLAFSRSFDSLTEQDLSKLPPINDHIFLACLMGMTPESVSVMQRLAPWVPIPWLQRLLKARLQVKKLTAECVSRRLNEKVTSRNDLLTSLIKAVDPETGERLTELEINTEAFAMIVAGSHTTAGTLTLLFSHLLQNPSVLDEVIKEIDSNLSDISTPVMPFKSLEERLPFTMACINENFRINPVFTMPLPRKVMTPGGIFIDGHAVPENVSQSDS
ncbi:hypothetical protein FANTH_14857 [Fusarium anthophilum]|uniref:Cytochrome P450 n=1 Tax=Fusarium anthophilum TaxID=48485 RepID=A0A8H4YFX2_9HYPO|nr:hypothetical protein FANTH_14857 [Fusarium anthophilum]